VLTPRRALVLHLAYGYCDEPFVVGSAHAPPLRRSWLRAGIAAQAAAASVAASVSSPFHRARAAPALHRRCPRGTARRRATTRSAAAAGRADAGRPRRTLPDQAGTPSGVDAGPTGVARRCGRAAAADRRRPGHRRSAAAAGDGSREQYARGSVVRLLASCLRGCGQHPAGASADADRERTAHGGRAEAVHGSHVDQ
jgi:hypothetical protein